MQTKLPDFLQKFLLPGVSGEIFCNKTGGTGAENLYFAASGVYSEICMIFLLLTGKVCLWTGLF